MAPWDRPDWLDQTQILLRSYRRWLGEDLVASDGSPADQSRILFHAPFVVVSHGTQSDPILNFGNQAALDLWQTDIETLTQMPSRKTAEPVHRDERARLLERTTRDGFVDDYRGIRISSTGRRFFIERATVWNLLDENDEFVGQAATFSDWKFLDD